MMKYYKIEKRYMMVNGIIIKFVIVEYDGSKHNDIDQFDSYQEAEYTLLQIIIGKRGD